MRSGWIVVALAGCGSVSGMEIDARVDSPSVDAADVDAPIDSSIDAMPCATVTGVRSRWRAEQNTADQTGTFNGTSIGANFAYTPGKHGSAFLLDGIDDAVTIDDADMLWPTASFTLEAWVKTTSTTAANVFVKYACGNNCPSGLSNSYFALALDASGIPQFDFRPETSVNITTLRDPLSDVNDGTWHHIVGVRDNATTKALFYVDGVEKVTANLDAIQVMAMSDADVNADFTTIGTAQVAGQTTFNSYFAGAIDDVAIYMRALGAAEVAALYNAPDGACP